ncbi:MAG: Nif11-like leader peptide family natural product precursor [Acidobacteriota bacterium]|nr:Nif11-like leader peptide family natural product precursor [Acidobacteriota bacterium]
MPLASIDDCHAQALVLSAIVAFEKSATATKEQVISNIVQDVLNGSSTYDAFASVVKATYGIAMDPNVLRDYYAMMKTPAPNAQIAAFLQRVQNDATLRKQFLAAATSYDALAQVAAANGVTISAQDLQNYIDPWAVFTSLLQGLRISKVIGDQQFQTYAGYDPSDDSISGFGHDVDVEMMQGILSAAGNAVRGTEFSSLGMPIGVVVLPAAGILIGGLSGQTYSWGEVGTMFENSFEDALEAASDSVQDFGSSVSNLFS